MVESGGCIQSDAALTLHAAGPPPLAFLLPGAKKFRVPGAPLHHHKKLPIHDMLSVHSIQCNDGSAASVSVNSVHARRGAHAPPVVCAPSTD